MTSVSLSSDTLATPEADDPPVRQLRNLIPLAMLDEVVDAIRAMLSASGARVGDDLDALVSDLAERDRGRLGAVYNAVRETAAFRRVVTAEPLISAASRMVGADHLQSPFEHAVFRMDLAGEGWRGFDWHQDFPYNVLCPRSVTAWIPLTPSGAVNGGVDIAAMPSETLYPVAIRYKRDDAGRRLATRDAFIVPQFHDDFEAAAEKPEIQPGDVLMFRNTVVHRSGRNPGPRHRFSIQVRFGNLLAPEMLARSWRHRPVDGFDTFAELHPELVAFKED